MNKERIKNGFAVALSALVCAGVVGSVAYIGIKSNKKDEAQAVLNVPLKASYVQTIYTNPNDKGGEDWKTRMNESAFKFGQNGYVVFGSGEKTGETLGAYVEKRVSVIMPVYSNLYTEYKAITNSYNFSEETIKIDNLYAGNVRSQNGWTKIQGTTIEEKQYLAPATDLQCPISKWTLCVNWLDHCYKAPATGKPKEKGSELLTAQSKPMNVAPVMYGYAHSNKYYGQISYIIDKFSVNDIYLTTYIHVGTDSVASKFSATNCFASVYGYNDDAQLKFVNDNSEFVTNDYVKDLSTIYDGEYLASSKITGNATGAYVTFRLSGVGKFRIVTGRTTEGMYYAQFGGFFLDTIK